MILQLPRSPAAFRDGDLNGSSPYRSGRAGGLGGARVVKRWPPPGGIRHARFAANYPLPANAARWLSACATRPLQQVADAIVELGDGSRRSSGTAPGPTIASTRKFITKKLESYLPAATSPAGPQRPTADSELATPYLWCSGKVYAIVSGQHPVAPAGEFWRHGGRA